MALLAEVTKNLKGIVASDHPDTGKILNDALKLLGKVNSQTRQLARVKPADKVVGKTAK